MHLEPHVDALRQHFAAAAEVGGEDVRVLAERLSGAVEAAARLALLEALGEAAAEIGRELAPGGVELRLRGRDPQFVVTLPEAPAVTTTPALEVDNDAATTRTTLRLPEQLKNRVEQAAAADGTSVNTWLVRAVSGALDGASRPSRRPATSRSVPGNSFSGWVG